MGGVYTLHTVLSKEKLHGEFPFQTFWIMQGDNVKNLMLNLLENSRTITDPTLGHFLSIVSQSADVGRNWRQAAFIYAGPK